MLFYCEICSKIELYTQCTRLGSFAQTHTYNFKYSTMNGLQIKYGSTSALSKRLAFRAIMVDVCIHCHCVPASPLFPAPSHHYAVRPHVAHVSQAQHTIHKPNGKSEDIEKSIHSGRRCRRFGAGAKLFAPAAGASGRKTNKRKNKRKRKTVVSTKMAKMGTESIALEQ